MKFAPIPKFPCTAEELAEFRSRVSMPGNFGTFSQTTVVNGQIYAEGTTTKPFRDNSVVWNRSLTEVTYSVCRGEVQLRRRPRTADAGIQVVDVENITQLEGTYSREVVAFYNARVLGGDKNFSRVPRLAWVTVPASEAKRLNIVEVTQPVEVEWPISIRTGDAQIPTTINPDTAFRFNPQTGRPEAFSITEYDREFPLVKGGTLSDDEILGSVQAILAGPGSAQDKVQSIRLTLAA